MAQNIVHAATGAQMYPVNNDKGNRLKTPIYVLSVFVAALKQYFGNPNRIPLEFSNYTWTEDQSTSEIWISEDYSADRGVIGKRPTVLVGLNAQQFPQQSLGDYLHHDMEESTSHMYNVVDSTVRFRCISQNMLSSLELATELRYFIAGFRHQIEKAFCLDKIRIAEISKTQRIEEYKEYWVTDLACELKYQEVWGIVTENLKIKSIYTDLKITDNAKKILPQQKIQS